MIAALLAAVGGGVAAAVAWRLTRSWFAAGPLRRVNYAGRPVPTGAGVVVAGVVLAGEAARVLEASVTGRAPVPGHGRLAVVLAVTAFALVGLVDDVLGDGGVRGLGGHLRALAGGRVTTGLAKLVAGAAVGLVVAATLGSRGGSLVLDGALVALSAHVVNLLDLRPGRALKAVAAGFAVLVVAGGGAHAVVAVGIAVGAGLGLGLADLREELMLGDTGAGALGAALGTGVAAVAGPGGRIGVVAGLAALTVAAEVVSLGAVIDRLAPLRALDRWGRRPEGSDA